ncbi:voltage-gated potassium channel [Pseudoteredinibacter isoporae]|uniref:Voltage-gated potassium channel n=1 Tax=Pseudoteredinibacter isoporae TaxID=570281 RepID=A0A7X0JVZ7_9GAMM|nr:voltage-gated potassium channel [Pseudoteredinibacter isoporae]
MPIQDPAQGPQQEPEAESLKLKLRRIIFGTASPAGKTFDIVLIYIILLSVLVVMLDSVSWIGEAYKDVFWGLEWVFTAIFTAEYVARLYCANSRWAYARSFYGIVDLLSILPMYLSLVSGDATYLLMIRILRVLRIFRVLKLANYLSEANVLIRALLASRQKIFVFFATVLVLAMIFGSLMYVVEGPAHGFTSIPKSIYWCIVTITTVGYGDITPQTTGGQMVAGFVMLTGYSIIAVPTGILTAELSREIQTHRDHRFCEACGKSGHEQDAKHCKACGQELLPPS